MKEESVSGYFSNKDLYIGLDVHKKRWVVSIRTYDLELKTFSMDASAIELEGFLVSNYEDALLHIVYSSVSLPLLFLFVDHLYLFLYRKESDPESRISSAKRTHLSYPV